MVCIFIYALIVFNFVLLYLILIDFIPMFSTYVSDRCM